ncbi:MAG: molybdopterin converting factor subunit 1 [Alphaproteobacteria bacterium]|mgnify:CR=1 FL=1|jgi:molybdopterin converting factor subunit 1|nr:molybdopterin converting factor subunit 1 [Alphaproteobacteria bacterium]MDP6564972.1 molybdopterin converting factor subunit 1 [Alphaproteobacteria bacterium]MDP6811804.1 molybdopterin converting factor subunit 1 [Alphaproteobacteria bacterium]|tara:strand:- start:135 stop:386 length:252 start_codon:yes stop_codon:yes gene_type:complete
MKVLYFAWLRSQTGLSEEDVDPPADVATVGQLMDWLAERSPGHAEAFANLEAVRCAVNQEYAKPDAAVGRDDEVAFFPPVTGG